MSYDDRYTAKQLEKMGSSDLLFIACDGLGLYQDENYPRLDEDGSIDFDTVIQDILENQ